MNVSPEDLLTLQAEVADPHFLERYAQMKALVPKWRKNAANWMLRAQSMSNERQRGQFESAAAQANYCADQLGAIFPPAVARTEPKEP